MKIKRETGSTLIEVVVVVAILAAVSLAFLGALAAISGFHEKNTSAIKAELLAEEGMEALRFIKEGGWDSLASLSTGEDHYLTLSPSSWNLSPSPEVIDGRFLRSFRVYQVSRDASFDIVSNGGAIDPDTLLLEVKVDWNWKGATTTSSYQSYITNI